MFEQSDQETMKKALRRPFPLDKDVPDIFARLLQRLAETEKARMSARGFGRESCRCD